MEKSSIPRPEKFSNQCDVSVWFKQIELFFTLTKVEQESKKDMLLVYLDTAIFQAVYAGISDNEKNYANIKTFLMKRYSSIDSYLDRISFIDCKFEGSADQFAANINSLFDQFSADQLREEILTAKFIAASPIKVASELKLRRPTTLSECVKIANSLSPVSTSTFTFSKTHSTRHAEPSIKCYRCGSTKHVASSTDCKARNANCSFCNKKGHFATVCNAKKKQSKVSSIRLSSVEKQDYYEISSVNQNLYNKVARPFADVLISGVRTRALIDTGSEISIIPQHIALQIQNKENWLSCNQCTFVNFDHSPIKMHGYISQVPVYFAEKKAVVDFFISSSNQVVLGVDCISLLKLEIKFSSSI